MEPDAHILSFLPETVISDYFSGGRYADLLTNPATDKGAITNRSVDIFPGHISSERKFKALEK